MIRVIPAVVLCAVMAGCGASQRASAPVLQRFEALHTPLSHVTSLSYKLYADVHLLQRALRSGRVTWVRRTVAQVRRDGTRLSLAAGRVQPRIQALVSASGDRKTQERYMSYLLVALRLQRMEGRDVAAMAGVVRRDPYLVSPSDIARMRALQRRGDREAGRAVVATRQSSILRRDHPSAFNYVPVREAAG